jgi:hypothetical protein
VPYFFLTSLNDFDWLVPLGLCSALALVLAVPTWLIIKRYIQPSTAEERKDAITLLFQIIGGVAFLLGAYFTWQQLINSRDELKSSREGQITERYTRAIDQLGKSDEQPRNGTEKKTEDNSQSFLAIRLGGIYALERIARDSERDHSTIIEVLTAFVREHAVWRGEGTNPSGGIVAPDIQAILTVIGRRSLTYGNGETERLDLSGCDLRGGVISNANLDGAILRSAHFEGNTTNLKGVHLNSAVLADTRFDQALLDGAQLRSADLRGASFRGTSVTGVDLTGADLQGADLRSAVGLTIEQINSAKNSSGALTDFKKNP